MRTSSIQEANTNAIRNYVFQQLPEEIIRRVGQLNRNLYVGPSGDEDDFPGFETGLEEVKAAIDDIGELWIEDGFVTDSEPKPVQDEETGEWFEVSDEIYHYSRRDVLRAAFGSELAQYL
jgi:hypothetical protein